MPRTSLAARTAPVTPSTTRACASIIPETCSRRDGAELRRYRSLALPPRRSSAQSSCQRGAEWLDTTPLDLAEKVRRPVLGSDQIVETMEPKTSGVALDRLA